MSPNAHFSGSPMAKSDRKLIKWTTIRRYIALLVVACVSTGCAGVVMQDPHTGATETCQNSLAELNPWSQTMACVANHEAQGWTRVEPK